jgi:E3 SUMO-protein ligase PIAS1
MVFCAGDNHGQQDIAFPHQSEIKVNGGEVKANLRGLKNKPGSTRPVDITEELRLKIPQYSNNVEMTYALTSKVDGGSLHVPTSPQTLPLPSYPRCLFPLRRGLEVHHAYTCV